MTDESPRLLKCRKCKDGGRCAFTPHIPVAESAQKVNPTLRVASHWRCSVCKTERHYGFTIVALRNDRGVAK